MLGMGIGLHATLFGAERLAGLRNPGRLDVAIQVSLDRVEASVKAFRG